MFFILKLSIRTFRKYDDKICNTHNDFTGDSHHNFSNVFLFFDKMYKNTYGATTIQVSVSKDISSATGAA